MKHTAYRLVDTRIYFSSGSIGKDDRKPSNLRISWP